jgi:cytochrome c
MKQILSAVVAGVAFAALCSTAYAADPKGKDEAQEHGCLKCHDVDKKKVGPSYKDISAKLKGKKVEEGMAAVKAKPVHKSALEKTKDSSLKEIMQWVMSL